MSSYLLVTRSHTDIVHKTIPYSGLENYILTTPFLLRLQRISQNSLVYLTFAPNKVKRFEHSLGTMHLAGQLFYSAITNTKLDTLREMFELFRAEIDKWVEPGNTKTDKERVYGTNFTGKNDNFKLYDRDVPSMELYNSYTPPYPKRVENVVYFALPRGPYSGVIT